MCACDCVCVCVGRVICDCDCDCVCVDVHVNLVCHLAMQVGAEILSSPAIATNGDLVFGCNNNNIQRVSSSGVPVWTFQVVR